MNIDITSSMTYYVTIKDTKEWWNHWRTNESGTHWENLMGMSWEEIDPPEGLVEAFKSKMAL